MVIDYVCKVISWVSVRFDQNQIFQFLVVYCDISVDYIMECCSSLCWHIETDYVWFSCIKTTLYFFFGKFKAAFVINGNLFSCHNTFHTFQFFLLTETVVCITLFY